MRAIEGLAIRLKDVDLQLTQLKFISERNIQRQKLQGIFTSQMKQTNTLNNGWNGNIIMKKDQELEMKKIEVLRVYEKLLTIVSFSNQEKKGSKDEEK